MPVELTSKMIGPGPKTEEAAAESWFITYLFVFLLYMTNVVYGSYLAMGVIEEKSTRTMELLLSTVRPFQLLLGKVAGMGLVALVQYGLWMAAGTALVLLHGSLHGIRLGSLEVEVATWDPWLLVAFVGFFLLGFFASAALFAAGGSLVSRMEDAQQITGPLTLILVVVFFIALYAISNPEKPLTVILSLIPLTSPMVMFVRVAVGAPPVWQVGLSAVVGVAAIVLLIWLAAKVFRAGVLLYYGRWPGLAAVLRALK